MISNNILLVLSTLNIIIILGKAIHFFHIIGKKLTRYQ